MLSLLDFVFVAILAFLAGLVGGVLGGAYAFRAMSDYGRELREEARRRAAVDRPAGIDKRGINPEVSAIRERPAPPRPIATHQGAPAPPRQEPRP